MRQETIWTSEPMRIGKHEWRVGVAVYNFPNLRLENGFLRVEDQGRRQRCTFYEWRSLQSHVWNDAKMWPTYDDNRGEDGGMPITLRKLYERERDTIKAALAEPFPSELTPIGEQLVIPGCERNLAPGVKQLSLF